MEKKQSCYPPLLLNYYNSFSKWLRLKGIQEYMEQFCHSHSTPRCILVGRDGHLHWSSAISIQPILFFWQLSTWNFLKKCAFLKQVTDKNKDTFLGYEK